MERQYARYDNTQVLKPIATPFAKPSVEADKLIVSENITTNAEYRKYMMRKADQIRERNRRNSI
jgi:hypothetical protein